MNTKYGLIAMGAFLFFACVNDKKQTDKRVPPTDSTIEADTAKVAQGSYYFSGDFMYFADAPTFKDCITGVVFPVAMQGAYKEVEKKYLHLKLNDPEGVYCEVMGFLKVKPEGEEGHPEQIVITSLIRFDRTAACHTGIVTDTTYTTYIPGEKDTKYKITLSLLPDYTFRSDTIHMDTKEVSPEVKGTWWRTSDENIVLLTNGEVYYQGIINFDNMNLELNDDNGKLWIFKKGM